MIRYLPFIVIALVAFNLPDKITYDEKPEASYHPLIPGQKYNYIADLSKYTISLDTSLTEINGNKYLKQTVDYGNSQSYAYYREYKGNVIYIKPEQKYETVQIPSNPTIGKVWYESDSTWRYTITGIKENFETHLVGVKLSSRAEV